MSQSTGGKQFHVILFKKTTYSIMHRCNIFKESIKN